MTALVVALPSVAVASEISAEEQQFVYELNVARSDPAAYANAHLSGSLRDLVAGFPVRQPLAVSEVVGAAAQLRTDDMVANDYFAHFNPVTGEGPSHALAAVGYSWSGWGENIGAGYPNVIAMLNGFLSSNSGHRESVMGVTGSGNKEIGVGLDRSGAATYSTYWTVLLARPSPNRVFVTGVVYQDDDGDGRMDLGEGVPGIAVRIGAASTTTNAGGGWSIPVSSGNHTVDADIGGGASTTVAVGSENVWVEISVGTSTGPPPCPAGEDCDGIALIDPDARWHVRPEVDPEAGVTSFFFGNPGDVAFVGDWDCDGVATPGLYRRSDGFVYLRNSNTQGVADIEFFFGNPGDLPLIGDWNNDGCDTVSIYRPAEGRIFVVNTLGEDGGGLGAADYDFLFGNIGDVPFIGDFNGDGIDTVGLYRRSTGFVYFRNSLTTGVADLSFFYGDPGDVILAGDWNGDGTDTVGVYRPSNGIVYLNYQNAPGAADYTLWVGSYVQAVAG